MKLLAAAISLYIASAAAKASFNAYHHHDCKYMLGSCSNVSYGYCCYDSFSRFHSLKGFNVPKHDTVFLFSAKKVVNSTAGCDGATVGRRIGDGCVNAKGKGATGAIWVNHNSKADGKEDTLDLGSGWKGCERPVLMDIAVIGGCYFNVNYHVPAKDTAEIWALANARATYEEVPQHLKKWETTKAVD